MKIVITSYDSEFRAEIPDASTLEELLSAIKGLIVTAGFPPTLADQHILRNGWGLDEDE